jgi:predicted aconitase/predicted aconitase with swiveling domain
MTNTIPLNDSQRAMLAGEYGLARQMGMRLLLDMTAMSGASGLVPISSAHLSGVSPLTGGLGLRLFLQRLAEGGGEGVVVPTTLNSAGCDENQFMAMRIVAPDFLSHHREIIAAYAALGVRTIQSCVPYEWEEVMGDVRPNQPVAWAESNAICYANSYAGLRTNRESGLSALASALTGYAPDYGLLQDEDRRPNLRVVVTAELSDPTDFSILGDWIGKQRRPTWQMPYGPIPFIEGLPVDLNHEQRKALSAAAANYGCALLIIAEDGPSDMSAIQDELAFTPEVLAQRYAELQPRRPVSLVVLGCPQASVGELRAVAELLRSRTVTADPAPAGQPPPLWVFTSARTLRIAERLNIAQTIRAAGALLLENTCPEVVPYDQSWVHHVLTNSMKAEHYIKSGLNGVPTSVMPLRQAVAVATGDHLIQDDPIVPAAKKKMDKQAAFAHAAIESSPSPAPGDSATGQGLPSQPTFRVVGEAFVTAAPITFLGYVNRETGAIEEEGHPADGQSLAGKIAVFPRGTGSSVAPYVLLELHYRGAGPMAIINSQIDQQTAPACSLEGIPYAYGFDADVLSMVRSGDLIELQRDGDTVSMRVLERTTA